MSDELTEAEARDRRVLEAVLGHSLEGQDWPADALRPGTRVRVIQDPEWAGPWRQVFEGTIDQTMPPRLVVNKLARSGEREYSVTFDEAQLDHDGEGPYRKAVIWDRYLQVI